MKDKILKLREEGKTYKQIQNLLNCSKSTISYYCGENQREKTKHRTQKRRKNILLKKVEEFKYRKLRNNKEKVRRFNKRDEFIFINKEIKQTFTWSDVLEKFGQNTFCYLSGEKINLFEDYYNLDHIIPHSRGGNNTLSNLGITHEVVNRMKSDLTPEELIFWCKKILEFNGFTVGV